MIVFDLETTGLNPDDSSIIDISAYNLFTGQFFFRRCRVELKPEAMKVNGITKDDLGYLTEKELLESFIEWIGKHDLSAYYIKFDGKFLKKRCDALGVEFDTNRKFECIKESFKSTYTGKKMAKCSLVNAYSKVTNQTVYIAHSGPVDVQMALCVRDYMVNHHGYMISYNYEDL